MHSFSRTNFRTRGFASALLCIALISSSALAWQNGTSGTGAVPARKASAILTAAERTAANGVKLETIREVTTVLSSKEFEGRGTAQPGADKAAQLPGRPFRQAGT